MRKLKTMDGNTAAAHVAYAFSEVSCIYPITPSSPMAESIDAWAADDRRNIFGERVKVIEMQSEGGASGAVHGALNAGSLTSTFTASQGLLLMIPNMYKIAGEQLPGVFHVAARALATHALSIFGDHSDVMGTRATGFSMLSAGGVQEVMDLAAVAHLAAIKSSIPFVHFFDGFRTSHENQKIEVWDYEDLNDMVDWDKIKEFKKHANNPNHPHSMGSAEQPETFFQHTEAKNRLYDDVPDIVNDYMEKVNEKIGTNYKPFNYYGAEDATEIIVAMGSVNDCAEEVVDYLMSKGKKVGLIKVRLYRPFSIKYLLNVIPKTVKKIAVLDRTKEPGSLGEPLFLDIVNALRGTEFNDTFVCGGRYGLGSKDTQPGDIIAVYENLWNKNPKKEFTISINDDVTHLSLPVTENPVVSPKGTVACKFWGLGADGTVGANKNSVKVIGDHTDKFVQAYFQYDSKKSGGITVSHLRFGDKPIKSTYYVKNADFVACHNPAYMQLFNIVQDVNPNGTFLLNCIWSDEELSAHLPAAAKKYIADNNIQFYTCDAVKHAVAIGLGARRTNTVLQTAFFKLANIIPIDEAVGYLKDAIKKTYGRKGDKIVNMNCEAVDAGLGSIHKVVIPAGWDKATDEAVVTNVKYNNAFQEKYIKDIMLPTNSMDGDSVPVSAFLDTPDGLLPAGTAAFEKRGVAVEVPTWLPDNCLQCNWCSTVCPHAAIRPFVLTDEEADEMGADTVELKGDKTKKFTIAISALDCTGCGSCIEVCPARKKALEPQPFGEVVKTHQPKFDYAVANVTDKVLPFDQSTVKGAQYKKPLLEFSGACPGCGETPYAKLVTQLYGDRMFIANATGCSSIWGCSAPSTPYTVNKEGKGPAWANSLFEDNAEFGLGMAVSMKNRREAMLSVITRLAEDAKYKETAKRWIKGMQVAEEAEDAGNQLVELCKADKGNKDAEYVVENADMLTKPSIWIFGGDGWAYDIGYGGVDHAIASGENVNIMVFDTEVYSNTGGQASKATPIGAVAKFAANGKPINKKNLIQMAMAYGYVYVAQIAIGTNPDQSLQAIREAEAYDGPSLIIAYAPCINHGVKAGMNKSMEEMKKAVRSGYWNLLRFNPELVAEKKNPLTLDSQEPTESYRDFIMGEVRYNSLTLKYPERAKKLFAESEDAAKMRYDALLRQHKSYEPN
ncbi:MAG: pyruvate:ferredoxin (flavodoxin) oxidoreductase [Peptostreptococcaceae bacterium]|nr:pyruvate:ferredoxin (flavodoxin) oxidoreductase [Peptostreptococcaceae bacterium]